MRKLRDLEEERERLLRLIEVAIPEKMRDALRAAYQPLVEPRVVVSKNEVGSEYANER